MIDWLLPMHCELSPVLIARAIVTHLEEFELSSDVHIRIASCIAIVDVKEKVLTKPRVTAECKSWFCLGCPHNTSTNMPGGSCALVGIGCHHMAV